MEHLDLLPCPFCGSEVKYTVHRVNLSGGDLANVHTIKCEQCKVRPGIAEYGESLYKSGDKYTDSEARHVVVTAWNTRV
jgi:Lar family restriction alleviation protein